MSNGHARRLDQLERLLPRPELPPERKWAIVREVAARHGLDASELMARIEADRTPPPALPPLRPGATRREIVHQVATAYGLAPAELAAAMGETEATLDERLGP